MSHHFGMGPRYTHQRRFRSHDPPSLVQCINSCNCQWLRRQSLARTQAKSSKWSFLHVDTGHRLMSQYQSRHRYADRDRLRTRSRQSHNWCRPILAYNHKDTRPRAQLVGSLVCGTGHYRRTFHRSDTDSRGTHLHRSSRALGSCVQGQQIQLYRCNCTFPDLCMSSSLAHDSYVELRDWKPQTIRFDLVNDRCKDLWIDHTAPLPSHMHTYKRMIRSLCLYMLRHSSTGSSHTRQNHLHRSSLPNLMYKGTHKRRCRRCCTEHLDRLSTATVAHTCSRTL